MNRIMSLLCCAAMALLIPADSVSAQTAYITGTVSNAVDESPIQDVRVQLLAASGEVAGATVTNAAGQYRISNLAEGVYTIVATRIGFSPVRIPDVAVNSGFPTIRAISMTQTIITLNPTIVSITRTQEKALESPASVSVVTARSIEERPSLSVVDHLRAIPGLDVTNGGLFQSNIVARGFNNAFSGSLLTLVDNRFASVPSLRVNVPALFSTTSSDIERMEVVLGPAAALYGPNSANGVLAIFTKSPFDSRGTTLTLEGGDRGILKGGLRTATMLSEKLAAKFSIERMSGRDFRYFDPEEPAEVPRPPAPGEQRVPTAVERNFDVDRTAMEVRADYRPAPETEFIASYGSTQLSSAIEITGANGAAQARNWTYRHLQLRARHKGFFAQAFTNFTNAGNSDSLDNRGTFLLRTGNPIVDKSRVAAFQLQQLWDVTPTQRLIAGFDFTRTDPRTEGTINGRNEDDDRVTEYGAYLHSLTRLTPKLDLVAAIRSDYQSVVDDRSLAPRVGIVFKPSENQNWRLTFNRADFTPANFAFFLDIPVQRLDPALPYFARALGNNGGFTYRRDCAQGVQGLCMKSPFNATPTSFVDAGGTALYRSGLAVVGAGVEAALAARLGDPAQAAQIMNFVRGLTPTNEQVGGQLALVSPSAGVVPFTGTWGDIAALESESYNVLELGYKSILGSKGRFAADLWYQRRKNFTGPASNISPSVFITSGATAAYLTQQLTPVLGSASEAAELAAQIAGALAPIPLGTVVPDHPLADNSDVRFSYVQVQEDLDIYGLDLAMDYLLTDRWSLSGTYSFVSEDFFPEVFGPGVEPLALNAPDNKASLALNFRDDNKGFAAELRGRYTNAFPVSSSVYQGEVPVNAFMDFSTSYRLPGERNILVALSVTNVFGNARPTFVGVPQIGRLAIGRIQYSF